MRTVGMILVIGFVVCALAELGFCQDRISKMSPKKALKEAIKNTQSKEGYKVKVVVRHFGDKKETIWEGIFKKEQGLFLFGKDPKGKRLFHNGKKAFAEASKGEWKPYGKKVKNLGARLLKGKVVTTPGDILELVVEHYKDKSRCNEGVIFARGSHCVPFNHGSGAIQPDVAGKSCKVVRWVDRASNFAKKVVNYAPYWRKLKRDPHWRNSICKGIQMGVQVHIGKDDLLIYKIRFSYEAGFFCNFPQCLGCAADIGEEIVVTISYPEKLKLDIPDKLKEKIGLGAEGKARAGVEEEYKKKKASLKEDDVEGHYNLGTWCKRKGLEKEAMELFKKVLELDSNHEQAAQEMNESGYYKHEGKWLTEKELNKKGLYKYEKKESVRVPAPPPAYSDIIYKKKIEWKPKKWLLKEIKECKDRIRNPRNTLGAEPIHNYNILSACYEALHRYREAVKVCKKAVRLFKKDAEFFATVDAALSEIKERLKRLEKK